MNRWTILDTEEVKKLIKKTLTRKILYFDIHHTWKPDFSNFDGKNHKKVQHGMYNYHTKNNGWSNIAQHLTLFPDGLWAPGRDFNTQPASISGRNSGAFMVEMVGNFDKGRDKLEGKQLESILDMCSFLIKEYSIVIRFHRDYSSKTCPGSGIDKHVFLKQIEDFTNKKEEEDFMKELKNWERELGLKHLKNLSDLNLIEFDSWKNKLGEDVPLWLFFTLLDRLNSKLT